MPERILSFAPSDDLGRINDVLSKKAQYVRSEALEQHVLSSDGSLVIEKHPGFSLILKRVGDPSSGVMEEIPVKCRESDFDGLVDLFATLGYRTFSCWKRSRSFYEWFPALVQLDEFEGFGLVVELLLYGQLKDKQTSVDDGLKIIQELGLKRNSEEEIESLKKNTLLQPRESLKFLE